MNAATYAVTHNAISRLRDPDHREEALARLVAIGEDAVGTLCLALESPDRETLTGALRALGAIGDPSALPALARMARHEGAEIAAEAIDAITAIGSVLAVQQLASLVGSPLQETRLGAMLGLARIARSALADAGAARRALTQLPTGDLAPFVKACLWQLEPAPRTLGIQAALTLDPPLVVTALIETLDPATTRRSSTSQQAVRDALAHVAAVGPLVEHLRSEAAPRPWLVQLIGRVSAALPPEGGRAALVQALIKAHLARRIDIETLIAALTSLGEAGPEAVADQLPQASAEALPGLVALLAAMEWTPSFDYRGVRYAVARQDWHTCVELGTRAIPALVQAFESESDPPTRRAIAHALWDLEWAPKTRLQWLDLALALGHWDEIEAAERMGSREVRRIRHALTQEIAWAAGLPEQDPADVDRRIAMLHALYRLRGNDVYDGLIEAAERDPAPRVRDAALGLITRSGLRYARRLASTLTSARLAAHERAEKALSEQAADAGAAVAFRRGLTQSLAAMRSPETIDIHLATLVDDPSPEVRETAGAALAILAERHPDAVTQAMVSVLDRPTTHEMGLTLHRIGEPMRARLFALIDCPEGAVEPQRIARGKNGLLAMVAAGVDLTLPLRQPLLTGSAVARQIVMEIYEALGTQPIDPVALAAYCIARGDFQRCLELGEEAVPAIRDALPLYDWRTAGHLVGILIRLGVDADAPDLALAINRLTERARTPDVDEAQGVDAERASLDGHPVALRRLFTTERRAAQRLLRDISEAQSEYLARSGNLLRTVSS